MLNALAHLATLLRAVTADRARLAMENVVLRQQLNVLQRSAKRPQLEDEDRIFWMLVRQLFADWAEHLVIVKPETVIRWHRRGFAYYWRQRSRRIGRPPIPMKVIHLIKKLSRENILWGAKHISDGARDARLRRQPNDGREVHAYAVANEQSATVTGQPLP